MSPEHKPHITTRMMKAQRAHANQDETLKDIFARLNGTEGMSPGLIAELFGVHRETVGIWMRWVGYEYAPSHFEEVNAMRSASIKARWEDPDFRKDMYDRLHNLGSKEKRRQGISRAHREHPERWRRKEDRMKEIFGTDPRAILERLYLRENLSAREISRLILRSREVKISGRGVMEWIKSVGIEAKSREDVIRGKRTGARIKEGNSNLMRQARELNLLGCLSQSVRAILEQRYPTEGETPTIEQIASQMNKKRVNVTTQEGNGLRVLRKRLGL